VSFSGTHERQTQQTAETFREQLERSLQCEISPAVPSGHAKVKDRFRFQFLVKGQSVYEINTALESVPKPQKCKMHVDVDPQSTFF